VWWAVGGFGEDAALNPVRVGFGDLAFQRRRDQNIASGLEELSFVIASASAKPDDRPVFCVVLLQFPQVESLFIANAAVDIADRDDAHTVSGE